MKFETVLKNVRTKCGVADITDIKEKVAIQVTLTGKDEGVFYVEINNGVISVEPYEYIDRDANIIISNDNFVKLMGGKLDPVVAFTLGKLKVEGDLTKALVIGKLTK